MLTVQEAATQVKLTQWAIYRAIRRGDLVAYKPRGRLRIDELDLRAWLDSTRVSPASAPDRVARQVPPSLALTGSKRSLKVAAANQAVSQRPGSGTRRERL
jgi:excisionase family DNA binding protein